MSVSQNIGQSGQSFLGYAGMAFESAYGSETAPTTFANIASDGFGLDNAVEYPNTVRSRARQKAVGTAADDSGSLDLIAEPENGLGYLLKAALGEETLTTQDNDGDTTDDTGVHAYTDSDFLPSLTVELGIGDIQPVRHTGCGVGSLELSHAAEDILTVSCDLPAQGPVLQSAAATPSYSDLRPFVYHDGTFTFDTVDRTVDLQEITVSVENNLEKLWRSARTPDKATVGEPEITGEVTLDFSSADLWEKTLGSTGATSVETQIFEGSMNMTWTSPEEIVAGTNYSLEVDLPRVAIEAREGQLNENDLVAESVTLGAVNDATAGYQMQATLTNGITTETGV